MNIICSGIKQKFEVEDIVLHVPGPEVHSGGMQDLRSPGWWVEGKNSER